MNGKPTVVKRLDGIFVKILCTILFSINRRSVVEYLDERGIPDAGTPKGSEGDFATLDIAIGKFGALEQDVQCEEIAHRSA